MICPRCKMRYYSKSHCPGCGLDAFSLNKGRSKPTIQNYRSLYMASIALFLVVIFMAVIVLKYTAKQDGAAQDGNSYRKYSIVRIVDSPTNKAAETSAQDIGVTALIDNEYVKLNAKGVQAHNEGDYDRAIIYFLQVYAVDGENRTIRMNLYNSLVAKGSMELKEKRFDDAIATFGKGLKYIDDEPNAYKGIGLAYLEREDYDNALPNMLTVHRYERGNDDINLIIAKIYYKLEDYESSKKFVNMIKDQARYAMDIAMITKLSDKNINDTKGKAKTGSSHFDVYYDGYENPVAGRLVAIILEEVYFSIGRELAYSPAKKLTTILYTNERFNEDAALPDWAGAVFDGKIRLPAGGLKNRSQKLKEVLAHEYTHAIIFLKAGNNCPIWLNEGLAQQLSGAKLPGQKVIAMIVRTGRLPKLPDLHRSFLDMSAENSFVAYSISYLFTKHLTNKYGMNYINKYLDKLAEKGREAAFKETFFTSMQRAYDSFLNDLKSTYK